MNSLPHSPPTTGRPRSSGTHETFTRLEATRQGTTVEIDLAVDSPPLFPIRMIDGLPVLAPQDLAARKILAILDRAEGRDFTDLYTLSQHFQREEIIAWAQQLDAGLTTSASQTPSPTSTDSTTTNCRPKSPT